MKKLIEIFGLGVLMILGGSMADYYLSTFSLIILIKLTNHSDYADQLFRYP